MISLDDLAAVRAHIGTAEPPTDDELDVAWDRLQSVEAVALEVVRGRLAGLRSRPTIFTVEGDYTENWVGTIKALTDQEAALASATGGGVAAPDGDTLKVLALRRTGRTR